MKKFLISLFFLIGNPVFAGLNITVANSNINYAHDYLKIVFALIMVFLTIISFLIWYRYGKDEIVIPVVSFYPPKGINPAEAELAYKGHVSEKGIVALIFYLAGKGYLRIIEEKEKTFSIEKLKDIPVGLDPIEKTVMKALNPFDYSFVTKEELRSSYIFYDTTKNTIKDLNKKREIIFYKDSINKVLFSMMVIFLAIVVTLLGLYCFYFNTPDANGIVLGCICSVICSICTYHLPKRNNTGLRLLGKLLGLKHFIEAAKKHEIEMLVEKNPDYFYDILPYAYILDVSDKWIKKFKDITVLEPKWLTGNKFYSTSNLNNINMILDSLNGKIML